MNNNVKTNWEVAFKRWYQNQTKCGYGSICTYCVYSPHRKPCAQALNKMCKQNNISIDYSNRDFERVLKEIEKINEENKQKMKNNGPIENWKNFAHAIVLSAVDDFRKAAVGKNEHEIKTLENFFTGEWCELLTDGHGAYILSELKAELGVR